MRRYSVHIEDIETGSSVRVAGAWSERSMLRKIRRGNAGVRGVPVRFFGKVGSV